jgi:hypothetical protein
MPYWTTRDHAERHTATARVDERVVTFVRKLGTGSSVVRASSFPRDALVAFWPMEKFASGI